MKVKKTEYTLLEKQYEFLFGIPKEKLNNPNKIYNDISCYYGGMGAGKCLGYDTPVLMYDGTIKPVQDIKVGDILMGDDSTKRTVVSLGRGKETMYRVIPNRGEPFTCNESHILTLKHLCNNDKSEEIIDIEVKDYINKVGSKQNKRWTLYKPVKPISFSDTYKPLIDPYYIGLWLADGRCDHPSISVNNNDTEIEQYLEDYYSSLNLRTTYKNIQKNSKDVYGTNCKGRRNPIMIGLRELNLIKNKHIPMNLKRMSVEDRLQLLAGYLDGDGCLCGRNKTTFEIGTNNKDIRDGILFIANSLGFSTYKRERSRFDKRTNKIYQNYGGSIGGSTSRIPTKLKRKRANDCSTDWNIYHFTIECIGEGDYYGFTLKENPRFLLGDFTVTHNTFCGSLRGLTYALLWDGCRGLVGAKSQDLLDNTTKRKYIEHMENIGLQEDVHYWWTDRRQTLNFVNGSIIRFKTLSDWQQFMSEEFAWIEFEEASFLEEIVFIKLLTRLRQAKREGWRGFYRSLFMHTNPQGKRGWINKFFVNPKTKKESYRFISASTRDNPYLGDEYVEMLEEAYSAEQVKEMIDGLDVDYDNTVAFPDFTTDNIFDDLEYDPNYPLILTCDFNYNPMCWYLMQEIDGTWHVLEELIRNNVTTKEMCQQIQPVLDMYKTKKLIIMGDSHGKDRKTNGSDYNVMLAHYADAGYDCTLRVQKSNPLIKDRLAVLRGLIRNAKGVRRLKVKSTCKWLLYNFEECVNQLANGGLKIPTDSEIQQDDNKRYLIHPIDAISYPMHYLSSLRAIAGEQEKL